MKVLMLNGSPRPKGCTYTALTEAGNVLRENGIDYEIFQIGAGQVRDCIGCGKCFETGKCVFTDDKVNEFVEMARQADGFIFGSPVYFEHPSGRIISFLDRAFFSCGDAFAFKPGAAVVSARRAGTSATLDVLNKYFAAYRMIMVGSTYWNEVHGSTPDEVRQDEEGLQTMRNLARDMAWVLKCLDAGEKAGIEKPELERGFHTNFIR